MKLSLVAPFALLFAAVLFACSPRPIGPSAPVAPASPASVVATARERAPAIETNETRLEREAAAVFRAMQKDLLGCFARAAAGAHAFITVSVVLGDDGIARDVATTGGARVGRAAMTCVERRVAQARFPAPRAGGTARLSVPFAFSYEADP